MGALIEFFVRMALLRNKPQDLPPSPALLVLLSIVSTLFGTLLLGELLGGYEAALGANLMDLALTMLFLFALLQITGHAPRWLQTATAVMGLTVLVGVVSFTVDRLSVALQVRDLQAVVDLALMIWIHVAVGHVIRHAIGVPLAAGIVLIFGYTLFSQVMIFQVFPPVVPN